MPFINIGKLDVIDRLPGWRGRIFQSPSMTFAYWDFDAGSSIHEHSHEQEEVWHVFEGELEVTIDGIAEVAGPGMVAIVPANVSHSVKARSRGKALVVDHPLRPDLLISPVAS
jgi:quercetin dioxygenase-like cupin family protein